MKKTSKKNVKAVKDVKKDKLVLCECCLIELYREEIAGYVCAKCSDEMEERRCCTIHPEQRMDYAREVFKK